MDTSKNDPESAFGDMATRLRQDEQLIADILAIRNPPKKTHWWEFPSFTSAIVAIVSLLLGSAGTIYSQREAKLREFTLAERATIRKERTEVLSSLHKLIAVVMKSTEDRLDIAKGNLNDLDSLERDTILTLTNLVDDQWREQKESNDFLLPFYFAGDKEVVSSWLSVRDGMEAYVACAETTYVRYPERNAPKPSCLDVHAAARRRIGGLWLAVNRSAGVGTSR